MPELYDSTRFPFCLSLELPALASPDEDSDSLARAKMHLRGYLRRTCGLSSFRDSDLEIDRLTAVWRIVLFERDGFEITRANGEALADELRGRYGATHAEIELKEIRRGSVLLTLVGEPSAFERAASDVELFSLGGMGLKEPVQLLALRAQVYATKAVTSRASLQTRAKLG